MRFWTLDYLKKLFIDIKIIDTGIQQTNFKILVHKLNNLQLSGDILSF